MSRISFRTAGLATLAITGSLVFAAPAAYADTEACGDNVITRIEHPAVVRTVDAVTHSEWSWARDVTITELEFARTLAEASAEVDWTRTVPGASELRYSRTVIDQEAVPAVPGVPESGHTETEVVTPAVIETEDEYEHETTGNVRWERSDWGAQNGQGKGWKKTGATREVEITPAVTAQHWVIDVPAVPGTPGADEQSHVESAWALGSPGADWSETGESRSGAEVVETATTDGESPAGDGWVESARRELKAVVDALWADIAPEGYAPTGSTRVASVTHEESAGTAAQAPEGEGWSAIEGSEVIVTDVAAFDEEVTPAWIELLLSPPVAPGTPDCELPNGNDDPTGTEDPTTDEPTTEEPVVAGPTEEVAPPTAEAVVEQVMSQGAAPAVATVLPNTGDRTPLWVAPAGLASVLAGAFIALGARRRSAR